RHVGAVIGVEPAQEILVRLAAARVLHREQPRHRLEDVSGPEPRAELELAPTVLDARRRLAAGLLRLHRDLERLLLPGELLRRLAGLLRRVVVIVVILRIVRERRRGEEDDGERREGGEAGFPSYGHDLRAALRALYARVLRPDRRLLQGAF